MGRHDVPKKIAGCPGSRIPHQWGCRLIGDLECPATACYRKLSLRHHRSQIDTRRDFGVEGLWRANPRLRALVSSGTQTRPSPRLIAEGGSPWIIRLSLPFRRRMNIRSNDWPCRGPAGRRARDVPPGTRDHPAESGASAFGRIGCSNIAARARPPRGAEQPARDGDAMNSPPHHIAQTLPPTWRTTPGESLAI
jgi:hypothetical protein